MDDIATLALFALIVSIIIMCNNTRVRIAAVVALTILVLTHVCSYPQVQALITRFLFKRDIRLDMVADDKCPCDYTRPHTLPVFDETHNEWEDEDVNIPYEDLRIEAQPQPSAYKSTMFEQYLSSPRVDNRFVGTYTPVPQYKDVQKRYGRSLESMRANDVPEFKSRPELSTYGYTNEPRVKYDAYKDRGMHTELDD